MSIFVWSALILPLTWISQNVLTPGPVSQLVCTGLKIRYGSSVVHYSGADYTTASTNPWNLFNNDFEPTCVVFPQSVSQIEGAMSAIYLAGSDYTVQAGAHSAGRGWNNINKGVLISLANMKGLQYNSSSRTVTVQPGATWSDIYNKLAPIGLSVVGGRVSDVGMGLILGGGLSFLSNAHGFAADQLVEADIVLSNGQSVTANAHNLYSDLFRAIKGGANRFGIVTRYELNVVVTGTADDKNWYGGSILYTDPESVKAAIKATSHYIDTVNDPKAILLTVTQMGKTVGTLSGITVVFLFYEGKQLPKSGIFKEFQDIPAAGTNFHAVSYLDITGVLGDHSQRGNGQTYQSSAFIPSESTYLNAYDTLVNFTTTFVDELDYSALALTPILQHQIDIGKANGGNAMNPSDGPYASVLFAQQWATDVRALNAQQQAGMDLLIDQNPASPGKPLFINECSANQNVYATYGDYDLLKSVYAKYDPKGFIVKHQQGPIGLE